MMRNDSYPPNVTKYYIVLVYRSPNTEENCIVCQVRQCQWTRRTRRPRFSRPTVNLDQLLPLPKVLTSISFLCLIPLPVQFGALGPHQSLKEVSRNRLQMVVITKICCRILKSRCFNDPTFIADSSD